MTEPEKNYPPKIPTDEHLRQFQGAVFPTDWGGLIGMASGVIGIVVMLLWLWFHP